MFFRLPFLNKSLVVKISPVLSISSSVLLVVRIKTVAACAFHHDTDRTWTLRPSETVSSRILPHASYSAVHTASPFALCTAIGVQRWSSW